MKKVIISCIISVLLAAVFAGCESKNDGTEKVFIPEPEPSSEVQSAGDKADPVTCSPLATAHFLEPVSEFSWEREYPPEYIVLHFTSAVVRSSDDPYNMDTVRGIFADGGISIHYIIGRDGKVLCYIPEDRAAWHAGKGSFADDERLRDSMNKYSIGIEMLAIGSQKDMAQYLTPAEYGALDKDLIGFTDAQYDSLKLLVSDICERYGIPFDREHIIGHDMYNPKKSDPGELFDYDRLFG